MNSTSSIEANGTRAPTAPDIVVYTKTSLPPATNEIFVILLVSYTQTKRQDLRSNDTSNIIMSQQIRLVRRTHQETPLV
jgi:hypothetical protein